jgi:Phosphatidylethanolamine-binding protein
MPKVAASTLLAIAGLLGAGAANAMTLTSTDVKPGAKIVDEQVFNGWDCTGKNVSPALSWSGAPKGTKSFAVSIYDPVRRPAAASGTGGSPTSPPALLPCRRAWGAERDCPKER